MPYDERYTPLLRRARLLTVAMVYTRGLPPLNPPALTALVDRWRPETHTFHLPVGEMTVTLEDVAMILGLPIRGLPVTGDAPPDGWRGRVEAFLGRPVPPPPQGQKAQSSGVPLRWLREQFAHCPDDADEALVTFHCRAWVLHLFGSFLFPDGTGDTASWMYIPCLSGWDDAGTYSWGSGVLAFLYRQLCEACRRVKRGSTQSGCLVLLQVIFAPPSIQLC